MGGSYSSSYIEPTKKLETKFMKIITEREILPMIIHRCSKLTKDKDGYNIWLDVCNFVYGVTGRIVQHKKSRNSKGELLPYQIHSDQLLLPEGDVEAAIHDMCHYIVADSSVKEKHNCGMDDMNEKELIEVEELAWTLETWIFSAIISEPDLVDMVSPHAEIETFHYWVRVNDPIDTTIKALRKLKETKDFDITLLRRILANWVQWKEKNPSKDAMIRGCLGWNQIGLPVPKTDIQIEPIGYVSSYGKNFSIDDFKKKISDRIEIAKEEEFESKIE